MNESLPLLTPHLRISIAENESNGGEKVTLPGAIATNNYIELWGERVDNRLVLVTAKEVSGRQGTRKSNPCLLNPWMVICLICIVATCSRKGNQRYRLPQTRENPAAEEDGSRM